MPENESNSDSTESGDRKWFVGPAQAGYLKYRLGQFLLHHIRNGPYAKHLIRIPGAETAAIWGFKQTIMSRDFDEIEVEGLPDKYKADTDNSPNTDEQA